MSIGTNRMTEAVGLIDMEIAIQKVNHREVRKLLDEAMALSGMMLMAGVETGADRFTRWHSELQSKIKEVSR